MRSSWRPSLRGLVVAGVVSVLVCAALYSLQIILPGDLHGSETLRLAEGIALVVGQYLSEFAFVAGLSFFGASLGIVLVRRTVPGIHPLSSNPATERSRRRWSLRRFLLYAVVAAVISIAADAWIDIAQLGLPWIEAGGTGDFISFGDFPGALADFVDLVSQLLKVSSGALLAIGCFLAALPPGDEPLSPAPDSLEPGSP